MGRAGLDVTFPLLLDSRCSEPQPCQALEPAAPQGWGASMPRPNWGPWSSDVTPLTCLQMAGRVQIPLVGKVSPEALDMLAVTESPFANSRIQAGNSQGL